MELFLFDFIEAFTHLVLYITNVYPNGYFEKKRKFNILLWHCTNGEVEKYIEEATEPIKNLLLKKKLYKYRILIKDSQEDILDIFTIEFDQFFHFDNYSYSSFERYVWDLFTHLEMLIYENYKIEKHFEISIDTIEDTNAVSTLGNDFSKDWETVEYETVELFEKKILKSIHILDKNKTTSSICHIYIENKKKS